jgi:hypothetical protein
VSAPPLGSTDSTGSTGSYGVTRVDEQTLVPPDFFAAEHFEYIQKKSDYGKSFVHTRNAALFLNRRIVPAIKGIVIQ